MEWKTQNINFAINCNIHPYKDFYPLYSILGLSFTYFLNYSYKAKRKEKINQFYKDWDEFQKYDSIENLFDKSDEFRRFSWGILAGSGFVFDFGLIIELLAYLDFKIIKLLKDQDGGSTFNKGPIDLKYYYLTCALGCPYIKLNIGYDFANLVL
ncbi:MAG: hypothetical protein GY830_06280 [Bacteroidetes bacterium]|nr:hypothetical protein [Bacteroidota bacterium]